MTDLPELKEIEERLKIPWSSRGRAQDLKLEYDLSRLLEAVRKAWERLDDEGRRELIECLK